MTTDEMVPAYRVADRRREVGDAAAAALAAVGADPLRESAHAALIKVHLAEHNQSDALREFKRYYDLLRAELDIEPTAQLRRLVQSPPGNAPPS